MTRRALARWLPALAALAGAALPLAAPAQQASAALFDPALVAALPPAERLAWRRYLDRSREEAGRDSAAMRAELRALGRDGWVPAVQGPNRFVTAQMTDEWFRGPEARRMAEVILSYQTPAGGWSKRVELRREPRQPGQSWSIDEPWSYIGTFDNDATTDQLWFLGRAVRAQGEPRWRDAFLRGVEYVLRAQYPSGCWPQVYPLAGGYHDAATFNDDMMLHVLRLLRDVAGGEYGFVPAAVRERAGESHRRGIECVLAAQVVVEGRPTVWGAQHHPLTLAPVKARAYEHPSLSGGESVGLMELLMGIEAPDARVVRAVHAAAAWFRRTAIHGYAYERGELAAREGAGPLWARFYEIGTDRPIFSNRDGVVLYRWSELGPERRYGYAWYTAAASRALRAYEEWARAHP